jgi:hypothetical protein
MKQGMKRMNRAKLWTSIGLIGSIAMACSTALKTNEKMPEPAMDSAAFNSELESDIRLRKPDASKVGLGEGMRLSEALNKNVASNQVSDEKKKLYEYMVNAYEHGTRKKKHGRTSIESMAVSDDCRAKFNNASECLFLKPGWSESWFDVADVEDDDADDTEVAKTIIVQEAKKVSKKKATQTLNLIAKQITNGSFETVPEQREGDYYRVFKRFKTWSPELDAFAKKLIEDKQCRSPELYAYLGLKAEEFFPSEDLMKTSVAIYGKADQCAIDQPALVTSKYIQNARFRMGLLSILKQDCGQAQKVFGRLAKMGTSDYSTRALYWNAYCAKNDSRRDDFLTNFDELFKTNPLGFHTLKINNGDSLLVDNLSKPIDPVIKMRSVSGPHNVESCNSWLALIEYMDHTGHEEAVRRLLSPVRKSPESLMRLEPGVRLYLSTFAFRAKDTMALFRILDSVFRTQSEYVVDSTLKLFYPMKHLDYISSRVKTVNPFLITALIRQESAFQEMVKSKVGAVGLMQLMPKTARLIDRSASRKRLLQPEVNLRVGIQYFENLVARYNGDVELALAAYNAGPEVVDRWEKRYPMKNRLLFLDLIPYTETRNYVTLIGRNYYWYTKIYGSQIAGIAQAKTVSEFMSLKPQINPSVDIPTPVQQVSTLPLNTQ